MYGGKTHIVFEVQLIANTRAEFNEAVALIEDRMLRVVSGQEIRRPMHPLTHGHGLQVASIVRVTKRVK